MFVLFWYFFCECFVKKKKNGSSMAWSNSSDTDCFFLLFFFGQSVSGQWRQVSPKSIRHTLDNLLCDRGREKERVKEKKACVQWHVLRWCLKIKFYRELREESRALQTRLTFVTFFLSQDKVNQLNCALQSLRMGRTTWMRSKTKIWYTISNLKLMHSCFFC